MAADVADQRNRLVDHDGQADIGNLLAVHGDQRHAVGDGRVGGDRAHRRVAFLPLAAVHVEDRGGRPAAGAVEIEDLVGGRAIADAGLGLHRRVVFQAARRGFLMGRFGAFLQEVAVLPVEFFARVVAIYSLGHDPVLM